MYPYIASIVYVKYSKDVISNSFSTYIYMENIFIVIQYIQFSSIFFAVKKVAIIPKLVVKESMIG